VPLAAAALWLAHRYLPADRAGAEAAGAGFDHAGTLMLAATLAAYALAMTLGRGNFGALNVALLAAAVVGVAVFVRIERRATSPLVRLALFGDRMLTASLVASLLVSTVIMATLVVGPFYLSGTLGLAPAHVGLVMSVGPLTVALTGVPAGRIVDRVGALRVTRIGLATMAAGCSLLAASPAVLGIPGYVVPIIAIAAGYAVFQTANNTAVMADVPQDRRGVISGILNLSRNLGLVTGASLMGAVFAAAAGTADVTIADPQAVASGLRVTFAVAGGMIVVALAVVAGSSRSCAYREASAIRTNSAATSTVRNGE